MVQEAGRDLPYAIPRVCPARTGQHVCPL